VQETILYDACRWVTANRETSRARVPVETARNEALETEHDGRDGVRHAERTSAYEAVRCMRLAMLRYSRQQGMQALSVPRLGRLNQHPKKSSAFGASCGSVSSENSW